MKKIIALLVAAALLAALAACAPSQTKEPISGVLVSLSDEKITADGVAVTEEKSALYLAHDIVYYQSGQGIAYGEGSEEDAHSADEAAAHTVLHIAAPGTYVLSGTLSRGQIAVDLGEDAETDETARVKLILNGADITCTVAPAIIFYSVYECAAGTVENPQSTVDTTAAGAEVELAAGTENVLNGSYVAKIYKSCELNEAGTEVISAKKLHKYDGALYSKMSMNLSGEGKLTVNAENEGIDSELHLTVNGGDINILSGDDGINTNNDGVSVTTINAGRLNIRVREGAAEGDGIDSNGWLVINGGFVFAQACSTSQDSGIDSDLGIELNGGTVIATGNMLDALGDCKINYADFRFLAQGNGGKCYCMKNADGVELFNFTPENDFTRLLLASAELAEGEYTLTRDGEPVSATAGGQGEFMPQGERPEGQGEPPEMPQGERPEGQGEPPEMPQGERPEGQGEPPEMPQGERPEGQGEPPEMPQGEQRQMPQGEASTVLQLVTGGNSFTVSGGTGIAITPGGNSFFVL